MTDTNPYRAPRAEVGQGVVGSTYDFTAAVADFTRSRAPLLGIGIVLAIMALVGTGSTLYALATVAGDLGGGIWVTFLALGVSAAGNLLGAGAVLWLRQTLSHLGPTTTVDQIALALRRLGNFWLLATVLWCLPFASNLAMTFGFWILPMLGAVTAGLPTASPLIAGADHWRNMVRVCLAAGAVLILLHVGTQVVSPLTATGLVAIQSRVWLFGGVLAQLGLGAMAWRQVPALEVFKARPSPANLAAAAAAHRAFWRVAAWGGLAMVVVSILSSTLMGFML